MNKEGGNILETNKLGKCALELSVNDCIITAIDEDLCNILELNDFHINSYENLYKSYTNNPFGLSNTFDVEMFLEKYVQLQIKKQYIIEQIMKNTIGKDFYYNLQRKYDYEYFIDYFLKGISIKINHIKEDKK